MLDIPDAGYHLCRKLMGLSRSCWYLEIGEDLAKTKRKVDLEVLDDLTPGRAPAMMEIEAQPF